MEKDFRHQTCSMPPNVSLSRFPTEIGRLYPESGFVNLLPSQHHYTNEQIISQNWHSHTPCLDNTFPLYYGLGRQKIPVAGPMPPLERLLVFDHRPFDTRGSGPHIQFRPSWAPNHLTARHDYTEDGPGDLTRDEMGENTEELDALLGSDDDFSNNDKTSTGRSPTEEIDEEVDSFVGPTAKRRRTGDQSLSCDELGEESRREKVSRALLALRSVVPGGRGKDGIAVIDEAIEFLRSLKVEMKAMALDAH